jgi:hypothetical protein
MYLGSYIIKLYKKNLVDPVRFNVVTFSEHSLRACRYFICSAVLDLKLVQSPDPFGFSE